jgi:hypothetical protein
MNRKMSTGPSTGPSLFDIDYKKLNTLGERNTEVTNHSRPGSKTNRRLNR